MVRKMWKAASGARKQHCPLHIRKAVSAVRSRRLRQENSGIDEATGTGLSLVKMLALRRINSLHPSPVPQTWRLVLFIRHLPQITPEELNEMKGWDPKNEADPTHF
jgi:hypothetical protein